MAILLSRRSSNLAKSIYTSLTSHFPPHTRPVRPDPFGLVPKHGLIPRFLCSTPTKSDSTSTLSSSISEPKPDSKSDSTSTSSSNVSEPKPESSQSGSQGGSQQSNQKPNNPVSWMSLFLTLATGGGLLLYYEREKKRRAQKLKQTNPDTNPVKEVPSQGKAKIGGPFNLIDHNGKPVTQDAFKGNWTVIYFGFTHCPDICPDELTKLSAAIDKVKEKSGIKVVPVFISVDPERDTVSQVREYVNEFHKDLIGLTGSSDEVRKASRAYRVYYMKTEEEGEDYLVDHSIALYLMDPNMEFVKFYGKGYEVESLSDGIISEINNHKIS